MRLCVGACFLSGNKKPAERGHLQFIFIIILDCMLALRQSSKLSCYFVYNCYYQAFLQAALLLKTT